jgi:probable phosphoglycerate mutase
VAGRLVLVRHGETEWSKSGQHTGRTDLPLTENGRQQALQIGSRLRKCRFGLVLSSPRLRARQTCELAGFGGQVQIADDLAEWDYGDYEGRRTADIRVERPGWLLWDDDAPGGETAEQVGARADRVIARVREADGDALAFAHGHILRVLTARWLDQSPRAGRLYALDAGTISTLGWEREVAVITLWNEHPSGDLVCDPAPVA